MGPVPAGPHPEAQPEGEAGAGRANRDAQAGSRRLAEAAGARQEARDRAQIAQAQEAIASVRCAFEGLGGRDPASPVRVATAVGPGPDSELPPEVPASVAGDRRRRGRSERLAAWHAEVPQGEGGNDRRAARWADEKARASHSRTSATVPPSGSAARTCIAVR